VRPRPFGRVGIPTISPSGNPPDGGPEIIMLDRLKKRWGVTSTWSFIAIFLAFSLAGLAITQCRPVVFHLLHFNPQTSSWIKVPTYLLLMVPLYQVFLLLFGALLGEFRFFWEKEKKIGRWLAARLTPRPR
jgi:hypothetical protein